MNLKEKSPSPPRSKQELDDLRLKQNLGLLFQAAVVVVVLLIAIAAIGGAL